MPDRDVPITRLIENGQKQLTKNPKDPEILYLLGRLHSLAFALEIKRIAMYYSNSAKPHFVPWDTLQVIRMQSNIPPTKEELSHLAKSLQYYSEACDADPKTGHYLLGLAWVHEQAAPYAGKIPTENPKLQFSTDLAWNQEAFRLYRKLFKQSLKSDLNSQGTLYGVKDAFASQEAAQNILRLVQNPKIGTLTEAERKELNEAIEKLKGKRIGITPIIFPLQANTPSKSVVSAKTRVRFDLAGDGVVREWPWITTDAAFLVWDPKRTGKITSGRQLFGTATFWMLFSNGYKALGSLDNNQDGWLTGSELAGIAAWRDRNSNGISDRGEVIPIQNLGVEAIRTRPQGTHAGMLWQSQGLRMKSGAFFPTYDWVPVSLPK